MSSSLTHLALLVLTLTVAGLTAGAIGAAAGFLARLDGASLPSAVLRGTVAFGGAFTIMLAVLTLAANVLI